MVSAFTHWFCFLHNSLFCLAIFIAIMVCTIINLDLQFILIFLVLKLYQIIKWLSHFSFLFCRLILSKHMHRFLESSACRSSELHQPAVQPEYRMQSSGQLSATSNEKSYRYFLLHFLCYIPLILSYTTHF